MALRFVLVPFLALLVSGCGVHLDVVSDNIDSIWLKTFSDKDLSSKVIVDESEWSEVIREIHRGRQTISKYAPEATLVIEYKNGSTDEFVLNSSSDQLSFGWVGRSIHPEENIRYWKNTWTCRMPNTFPGRPRRPGPISLSAFAISTGGTKMNL